VRAKFLAKVAWRPHEQDSRVVISVLFDLRSHGWAYTVSKGWVRMSRPDRLTDGQTLYFESGTFMDAT
jgi:hypothetical protein